MPEDMNVKATLIDMQLGQYADKFEAEQMCLLEFAMLSEADLIGLGVADGDRQKMMQAIEIYANIFEVDISFLAWTMTFGFNVVGMLCSMAVDSIKDALIWVIWANEQIFVMLKLKYIFLCLCLNASIFLFNC